MKTTERLEWLLDHIPAKLRAIDETTFSRKLVPATWSQKEILGHLIDSAANNHQRFIRAQFEEPYTIQPYEQNRWVELNRYQQLDAGHIIALWEIYNRQLLEVMRSIPEETLAKNLISGNGTVTLGWLIDDYVAHMEHHLNQLTDLS